jgi:hypothetical protein
MATPNENVIPIQPSTYDDLIQHLHYLAGYWRETKSQEAVYRYQFTLRTLLDLGYREWLDVEAELPKRFMPAEYADLVQQAQQQKRK